jgi:phenylpropionate dioxygenase-like ring-hydroxylating dioxygenase large terminal subunit
VFELEMTRIFGRAWIYLGHVSQIPEPGCLFATRVGREPVLVIRQADGTVRAFINRCAHKGMQLCADDNTERKRLLRCGYHGWTYHLDGRLRSVPAPRGYSGTCVSPGAPEGGLTPIGAVAEYRGFLFGRLFATGPELTTWLGPMRSSLDNFVDRAPAGRVEVAGGVLRYMHHANWKFFLENTLDALHPMVVHQAATTLAKQMRTERSQSNATDLFELQMLLPFGASYSFYDEMGQRGTPYGHADLGNRTSLHSSYSMPQEYLDGLRQAHGEKQAHKVLEMSRNNSVLYPSVMFKAPIALWRVVKPIAVDCTLIETWHFRLCGAPEELFHRTLQYSTVVNSSAGPVGPDDHAAYRRLQSGLAAQSSDWVLLARYAGHEQLDEELAQSAPGTSDFVYRNQFAAWARYMAGEEA